MRLLLVEDNFKLASSISRGLRAEGYAVDVAADGEQALMHTGVWEYDAVVLDLLLPVRDGIDVCRSLRERGLWVPILMLTARDGVDDRIAGLDAGADDYLAKPFDFGELLARIRALVRRAPQARPSRVEHGDLVVDPATRKVLRGVVQIELTAREFAILEYLARRPGHVVSRTELLEHVWDANYDGSTNVVDVHMGHLRKKLQRPGDRGELIRTVRGVGFVLDGER
ncbi:MAG: response regulator transcription factor [Solirubrobacteraceae bacterium]